MTSPPMAYAGVRACAARGNHPPAVRPRPVKGKHPPICCAGEPRRNLNHTEGSAAAARQARVHRERAAGERGGGGAVHMRLHWPLSSHNHVTRQGARYGTWPRPYTLWCVFCRYVTRTGGARNSGDAVPQNSNVYGKPSKHGKYALPN